MKPSFSLGKDKSSAFQRFCYCDSDWPTSVFSETSCSFSGFITHWAGMRKRRRRRRRTLSRHQRWGETASISDEFTRIIPCQLHFLCILFPYLHPHSVPSIPTSTLGIVSPQRFSVWRENSGNFCCSCWCDISVQDVHSAGVRVWEMWIGDFYLILFRM